MPIYRTPVKAYSKSIIFNGTDRLFPIGEPKKHAEVLKKVIRDAEDSAYEQGRLDAQKAMRQAIGLPR